MMGCICCLDKGGDVGLDVMECIFCLDSGGDVDLDVMECIFCLDTSSNVGFRCDGMHILPRYWW